MEVKMAAKIIQTLSDAGCHYGHQTRRWNPTYIFLVKGNGIYILDLKHHAWRRRCLLTFLKNVASKVGRVLFVGTKKQAQEPIATEAARANVLSVGLAVCSPTLSPCVPASGALRELEAMVEDGRMATLPKKEQAQEQGSFWKLQLTSVESVI